MQTTKRRLELDMKQETLALEPKVSGGFLSVIEGGKATVSIDILWRVAQGITITLSDFLKGWVSQRAIITLKKSYVAAKQVGTLRTFKRIFGTP